MFEKSDLGPAMQEEVLRLVLLALEDGSALSRKVLVMFVVQRLEPHFPQASKTSIGHVVQLLYRASCFKGKYAILKSMPTWSRTTTATTVTTTRARMLRNVFICLLRAQLRLDARIAHQPIWIWLTDGLISNRFRTFLKLAIINSISWKRFECPGRILSLHDPPQWIDYIYMYIYLAPPNCWPDSSDRFAAIAMLWDAKSTRVCISLRRQFSFTASSFSGGIYLNR